MEIKQIVKELTLEEKASLCSGSDFWHTQEIERLGIPRVMMCDGPVDSALRNPSARKN